MKSIILYDFEIRNLIKNKSAQIRRVCKINNEHFWSILPGYYTEVALVNTQKGLQLKVAHRLPVRNGEIRKDIQWIKCPFGAVGEELIVKETWAEIHSRYSFNQNDTEYCYKADYKGKVELIDDHGFCFARVGWKSPITMPREASRLTIIPERIWVEKVQDITKDGLLAEGAETDEYLDFVEWANSVAPHNSHIETLKEYFAKLWDLKNRHSEFDPNRWDANPMVFAAEVRVK